MRLSTSLALAALGLAASALPAAAGTLLVPQQFPTIQKALNAAKPYDTVLVSAKPGGAAYSEAVTISTPHVVLRGLGNPVIDGAGLGAVVHLVPGFPQYDYTAYPNGIEIQASSVTVRGMTVQGFAGSFQPDSGTGINVDQTSAGAGVSDILISGNTLRNNGVGLVITGYTGSDPYYTGTNTYTKGFQVIGNALTGNTGSGATINGASVLVAGNKVTGSGGDGLDVTGIGVTVSGNEAGGNANYGVDISDAAFTYNPAVNEPKSPNPAPVITSFNYIHDNGGYGIQAQGTQTISGNTVVNSTGHGIQLDYADYSTISGNLVGGTALMGAGGDDGTGIYAEYGAAGAGGLTVSGNQISGNAGDGIGFYEVAGGVISLNNVVENQGIGIHLSDYAYQSGEAPTTVTLNRAQHNKLFDARDDTAAPSDISYNGDSYYGDGAGLYNVWTKNQFGTTDPVGLSK